MKKIPSFPGLIPDPREIQVGEREVEPPETVRLVGTGLSSDLLRTAGRILARGGVGEGEDAFPIEFRSEEIELCGLPAPIWEEAYELRLTPEGALVRACGQKGILWGVQTLASLFRTARRGLELPEMEIRDWPDLAWRGLFVENKWGPDRMGREDWFRAIDRLASLKMNCLGIGLYGCWGSCRFEGQPTEFLMVPVPGHPELKSLKRLRWYAPSREEWRREEYLPRIFGEDFLGDLVSYGRKRGVTVIPFVNSLGHNTLIPRKFPEVSAKDEEGNPLGIGYCLSNPETRRFLSDFYGSIVERYFPEGADSFHVQLDEVWPDFSDPDDPHRKVDPWCRCADCRARTREELLHEYVIWLVEMLCEKGVGKVVMWNDQLTRHMDALDERFARRLQEKGLADRLVLHWWWYSNEELHESTRVSIGKKLGLSGWVAPMSCYFNWAWYSYRLPNIELMLDMAHEEGGEGAVAYSVYDPGWADHEVLLSSLAWNRSAVENGEKQVERWARGVMGNAASRFLEALVGLRKAASSPALDLCYHYRYTYCREEGEWPRPYPEEALDALDGMEDADGQLVQAAREARSAGAGFAELIASHGKEEEVKGTLTSLRGEAARIEALARVFGFLLPLRREAREGVCAASSLAYCAGVRESLLNAMQIVEKDKPHWVAPAILQSLSVLLEYLDQLTGDLDEVRKEKRTPEEIRWRMHR